MVTLAYQRAVPATLLTQWTLATILSRKHQAVVMAVQEISLTITKKKNVGEQLSVFSGSKGKNDNTIQGPLKKWTEHSQELHLLKIHSRGAPITPRGWKGIDFLDHELL